MEYYSDMKLSDESKDILDLLENSSQNIFITGRAGTGKSTLLQHFRDTTKKNIAVVAPTGIAALNIKGQTIHSFFKFKIGVIDRDISIISDETLSKLYKKLDTLVIDEISMVRADLFDCVERFLRLNGPKPGEFFGGVQMVAIGDMFQLPPVVAPHEQYVFIDHYQSPYFFDSKSYPKGNFQIAELTEVYRQSDTEFVSILDRIRTGRMDENDLYKINSVCCLDFSQNFNQDSVSDSGGFQSESDYQFGGDYELVIDMDNDSSEGIGGKTKSGAHSKNAGKSSLNKKKKMPSDAIYLVSTNASAEVINNKKLTEIYGAAKTYKGHVQGAFDRKTTPAPEALVLKVGAQVMMLRNDPMGRWVNGDLGIVKKLNSTSINVQLRNGKTEEVESESWESVRYEFDSKQNRVSSEVVGKYIQIPVKLAWAVTIHKSQGKTFDNAIIDFGKGTFAHGQAYVALSRVRSLEGIQLTKPITRRDIQVDQRVVDFLIST